MQTKMIKLVSKNVVIYFLLIVVTIFSIFPFIWTISSSFKNDVEVIAYPPTFIPKEFTFSAFVAIFKEYNFGKYFLNSFIVALGATLISLFVGSLAAYSFSRLRFPGDNLLLIALLGSMMLPTIVLIIPIFIIFERLSLIDTHFGLILANCCSGVPLVAWMMRGFFSSIPGELEDSAIVDGCSYFGAFFRILLPISAPGLAASAIFIFLIVWNEFIFALIFTNETAKTLPVITSEFIGVFEISWNRLAAAGVVTAIPILIFILIFQKWLISGLTQGAVKG
ncbi:MAG: carbohydrate ABC transporter permease [Spirochaetae bacterium HGW-Spirochaetae-8]|nr:MAG: carbohydrate ABC transporter permease [Spirochaetae bacterium HGW-Spirochaetae-8]